MHETRSSNNVVLSITPTYLIYIYILSVLSCIVLTAVIHVYLYIYLLSLDIIIAPNERQQYARARSPEMEDIDLLVQGIMRVSAASPRGRPRGICQSTLDKRMLKPLGWGKIL